MCNFQLQLQEPLRVRGVLTQALLAVPQVLEALDLHVESTDLPGMALVGSLGSPDDGVRVCTTMRLMDEWPVVVGVSHDARRTQRTEVTAQLLSARLERGALVACTVELPAQRRLRGSGRLESRRLFTQLPLQRVRLDLCLAKHRMQVTALGDRHLHRVHRVVATVLAAA